MKKLLLLPLLLLWACGTDTITGDGTIVSPSPSPVPSPSPMPPPITVARTLITAFVDGRGDVVAWGTGIVPILESHQVCIEGSVTAAIRRATTLKEIAKLADVVPCPPELSFGPYAWNFFGTSFCLPRGDIFGPSIFIQCFTPGDVDVTVTPPHGPQGRAIFRVQPGSTSAETSNYPWSDLPPPPPPGHP